MKIFRHVFNGSKIIVSNRNLVIPEFNNTAQELVDAGIFELEESLETTNQDIKLIHEFMENPLIFSYFQKFLESKNIESTEAENILKTLVHEDE